MKPFRLLLLQSYEDSHKVRFCNINYSLFFKFTWTDASCLYLDN